MRNGHTSSENLGYSFGFLLIILGRMQLFTENTITTILPLVATPDVSRLVLVLRLWGLVLAANVAGAAVASAFILYSGTVAGAASGRDLRAVAPRHGLSTRMAFLKAIPAGILVAAIVWMIPAQQGNEVLLIVLITWLIAAGDFTHIIAGSVEMWVLLLSGDLAPGGGGVRILPCRCWRAMSRAARQFFAFLAWGQVKAEVEENPPGGNLSCGRALCCH